MRTVMASGEVPCGISQRPPRTCLGLLPESASSCDSPGMSKRNQVRVVTGGTLLCLRGARLFPSVREHSSLHGRREITKKPGPCRGNTRSVETPVYYQCEIKLHGSCVEQSMGFASRNR